MLARGLFPNNEEDPGPKMGVVYMILWHCAVLIVVLLPQVPIEIKETAIGTLFAAWIYYGYWGAYTKALKKQKKEQLNYGMRYLDWVEANKRRASTDSPHHLPDDEGLANDSQSRK